MRTIPGAILRPLAPRVPLFNSENLPQMTIALPDKMASAQPSTKLSWNVALPLASLRKLGISTDDRSQVSHR
jgi:hypothetical protein